MGLIDIEKIKRLRTGHEMTQHQAARKAGFKTRQAWSNIERGRQLPTLPTLERIAKALGVKAKDLLK